MGMTADVWNGLNWNISKSFDISLNEALYSSVCEFGDVDRKKILIIVPQFSLKSP